MIMNIFIGILLLLIKIEGQFNIYYSDFVSKNDIYFHCLHYKVLDDIVNHYKEHKKFSSPYQIIPYCIRPYVEKEEEEEEDIENKIIMMEGNIYSKLTFIEMKNLNLTAKDLLLWSAPIDLIERYENYLETLNKFSMYESYNNCTTLWFGPYCQYTFDSNKLFNDIVRESFISKEISMRPDMDIDRMSWTCYILIECNRGPPPSCLDWREICDGTVDCINGIDEINCLELEINECKDNEYRCQQGMCIPEQFLNDNPYNPDCLDGSDENDYQKKLNNTDDNPIFNYDLVGDYKNCFQDPSFRCEDTNNHLKQFIRNSVCGDGQADIFHLPHKLDKYMNQFDGKFTCRNQRTQMLEKSFISKFQYSNLSYECWSTMMCFTYISDDPDYTDECLELIMERDDSNYISIKKQCNHSDYIIFPEYPILQGHVRFGYWTNQTYLFDRSGLILYPDFICYDVKRCMFIRFTLMIANLTCIPRDQLPAMSLFELIEYFHMCNYIYTTGNETDCIDPSLFHCPGTSKCISKHRLLDGINDCYNGIDEIYEDSCQLNKKYRFQCLSQNKCISFYAVRNGFSNCPNHEDEIFNEKEDNISFHILCNGYTHLSPILINGQNETDETNCEQWPCNNQYTRCDGAWTCSNGADEIDCNQNSKCYGQNSHECISPINLTIICLPLNKIGNGIIDCLGATDERKYCRDKQPINAEYRYRCWDDELCISWIGDPGLMLNLYTSYCVYERNFIFNQYHIDVLSIQNTSLVLNIISVLKTLLYDQILIDNDQLNQIHFYFDYTNNYQILSSSNQNFISEKQIDFRDNSNCNRGILIRIGKTKNEYCLCPPSYYGNQCQYQNQRVSLTVQFIKECSSNCQEIYSISFFLIDSNRTIHSYEQMTYITTKNCNIKYNFNLLYRTRQKDLTKNYSIHIDIYKKINLNYYISWIIPIPFIYLPINRISTFIIIPSDSIDIIEKTCPINCGRNGYCNIYINTKEYFCRCHFGWSGINCNIQENLNSNCSLKSSISIGIINNRSICLCSFNRTGPRCFLHSICSKNPCHNNGQCIPEDNRWSINRFQCICSENFFGETCQEKKMRIDISFDDVEIPQAILIYLISVQIKNDPLITTISKKIGLDEDRITIYTSILYNMIFIQINSEYYLSFTQMKSLYKLENTIKMKSSDLCPSINKLFDKRIINYHFLRRSKSYHILCKENLRLSCFHDSQFVMCLCNKDRHANCFPFQFDKKSTCLRQTQCENNGHCTQDLPICPISTICVCQECYYGEKCQFTTKDSGLSLDFILGYQIRQNIPIYHQRTSVKISLVLTKFFMLIGLISSTLSILTFRSKTFHEVGCGLYLYSLSIISFLTIIIFTLKFWFLIFFQTLLITNKIIQKLNCFSNDFILQSLLTIEDWLSVCISIERLILIKQSNDLKKRKSVQIARWIIIGIILLTFLSYIYDPINRQLIDDIENNRTWCIIKYSPNIKIFNLIIRIIHFIIPFILNIISSLIIIITITRVRSNVQKKKKYKQHLYEQFNQYKNLIISPIILIILSVPRLIISFLFGCIKIHRNPWLFIFAYYISFIPPLLTTIIFILPSKTYTKELIQIIQQQKNFILRCLHWKFLQ